MRRRWCARAICGIKIVVVIARNRKEQAVWVVASRLWQYAREFDIGPRRLHCDNPRWTLGGIAQCFCDRHGAGEIGADDNEASGLALA